MKKNIRFLILTLLCCLLTFTACVHNTPSGDSGITPPVNDSTGPLPDNEDDDINSEDDSSDITKDDNDNLPDAYADIIKSIINAFPWNDESFEIVPEYPELSFLYYHNSSLSEIGFALLDLDNNGQDELIIGDFEHDIIYDVFTITDSEAVQILTGGERCYYTLYENGYIECQWSDSAANSGYDFLRLEDGKLNLIERFCLDAVYAYEIGILNDLSEADGENCWFRSDNAQKADYESITYSEVNDALDNYHSTLVQLVIVGYTTLDTYENE